MVVNFSAPMNCFHLSSHDITQSRARTQRESRCRREISEAIPAARLQFVLSPGRRQLQRRRRAHSVASTKSGVRRSRPFLGV